MPIRKKRKNKLNILFYIYFFLFLEMFIYVNGQDITTDFYGANNYNSSAFGEMDIGRENDTLIISLSSSKLVVFDM